MKPLIQPLHTLARRVRQSRNFGTHLVLTSVLLTSASCATAPHTTAIRTMETPSEESWAAGLETEGVVRASKPSTRPVARAQSDQEIHQVAYEQSVEPQTQPAGHFGRAPGPASPDACPPIEHSQECRVPVSQLGTACPPGGALVACPKGCPPHQVCLHRDYMPSPEELADEYICDGGDRGNPIFYNNKIRDGIDAEDTFATFDFENGEPRVEVSNTVCIYAPRFAAVSSISNVVARDQYDKLGGVTEDMRIAGYEADMRIDERTQRDRPVGIRVRDRASGLIDRQAEGLFIKNIAAENHIKLINVFEDLAFVQEGLILRDEAATISRLALFASEWSVDQTPVIVAEDVSGHQVTALFKAEEYVGVEERFSGRLRICKLADKQAALPGDIVTFTLRIDSLEKGVLRNVIVTDSLTPRLELLPDSLQSDLPGEFAVQPNKEGSSTIHFTLKDPLQGLTGGVITFQAKVR